MDKKPTILYVSDTYKTVIGFLKEVIYDLNELKVPILISDRRKLMIETEHYKLRCLPVFSNNDSWVSTEYVTHFANGTIIYQGFFLEKVSYRLRQNVKELTDRNEVLKLLSEGGL